MMTKKKMMILMMLNTKMKFIQQEEVHVDPGHQEILKQPMEKEVLIWPLLTSYFNQLWRKLTNLVAMEK